MVDGEAVGIILRRRAAGAVRVVEAAVQIICDQLVCHRVDRLELAVSTADVVRRPRRLVAKIRVRYIVVGDVVEQDAILVAFLSFLGQSKTEGRALVAERFLLLFCFLLIVTNAKIFI